MMQIAMQGDQGFMAHLCMNDRRLRRFTPLVPARICVTNFHSAERRRVERFIEHTFSTSYGAEIARHYPALLSVHDEDDNILAALGFRYARDERLFLEQYLDAPIEAVLGDAYSSSISRDVVVEVGNLASSGQGASIFLFTALNAYLEGQGMEVSAFTATDFLYRYFKRLGFKGKELAPADQNRLPDSGASWGSYYQENPQVVVGHIQQVLSGLRKHMEIVLRTEPADMHAILHTEDGSTGVNFV